jgi:hypothetical protein
VRAQIGRGLDTLQLGGRPDRLDVGLPLDARAAPREEEREEGKQVHDRHHQVAHAPPLAEMNALVAEQDVAVDVAHRVPGVGHPERAEEHGVITCNVHALAAQREERKRDMDGPLEEALALLPDAERRKLDADLVEEALASFHALGASVGGHAEGSVWHPRQ